MHFIDIVTQRITCDSIGELMKALEVSFGDANRKTTAQNSIANLRQNNRSFADYYAAFTREIPHPTYNEEAQKSSLVRGLSVEMLTAIQDKDTSIHGLHGAHPLPPSRSQLQPQHQRSPKVLWTVGHPHLEP